MLYDDTTLILHDAADTTPHRMVSERRCERPSRRVRAVRRRGAARGEAGPMADLGRGGGAFKESSVKKPVMPRCSRIK